MSMSAVADELIYVPDHEEQALRDLPSQLRNTRAGNALVRAWGRAVQRAEDELFGLYRDLPLDQAHGKTLEQWGAFVGAERFGLDDDDYRALVLAKARANRSPGDVESLLLVWAAVTAPSVVSYEAVYPACFVLTAYRAAPLSEERARYAGRLMREVAPAGRAMVLTESTVNPFTLDTPGLGLDAGRLARVL